MEKLIDLPNIGKVLAIRLNEAGIRTPEALISIGAEKAFSMIKIEEKGACINMLFALEGAVQGIRWHQLTTLRKEELKRFIKSF